ncbi:MAG: hypothetical protein FD157_311 [Rhodocyclaceae bacterium]|nr:MAG: hypothetical protein FD157_311 [Rhodocyclaceae bacterium]
MGRIQGAQVDESPNTGEVITQSNGAMDGLLALLKGTFATTPNFICSTRRVRK